MTVVPSRAKRPPSQTWSFAMIALQSKSAFLYKQIRRALRSGRYVPGERLDPATIAEEFHTSATPVRFALYRLVGEGLIADHARSGLYVPLFTEVALRDLYDWMRRLLLMACDIRSDEHTSELQSLIRISYAVFCLIQKNNTHKNTQQ